MTDLAPFASAELDTYQQSPEDVAIARWLAEQASEHTRRSYEQSMRQWRAWLAEAGVSLWSAQRHHAVDWRNHLTELGRKPKTVDGRLIAVRSFYDWLTRYPGSPLQVNPLGGKKLLLNTGAHTHTQALSPDEVRQFTAAARKAGQDRRLLMLFLVTTGCRIKEAIGLKVEDLGRQAGHPVATLTRKGGRREEVAVDAQVHQLLLAHVAGRGPDEHVFRARGKGGFTYAGAYKAVGAISTSAGLVHEAAEGETPKPRVHPHMLRATLITLSIDANKPITDIQDQVGHRKTETTRMYDRGGKRLRRMASVASGMAEMVDLDDEASS